MYNTYKPPGGKKEPAVAGPIKYHKCAPNAELAVTYVDFTNQTYDNETGRLMGNMQPPSRTLMQNSILVG